VGVIAEQVEEVEDLVAVEEVGAVEEEDRELNFIKQYT
jgi:hypothetical protein